MPVRTYDAPTRHMDAGALAPQLASLFPPDSALTHGVYAIEANASGAALRITATEAGYRRVRSLLVPGPCDPPSNETVVVIPLTHRHAAEFAAEASGVAGERVRVIADVPTNSLVVVAPSGWGLAPFTDWVKARDR